MAKKKGEIKAFCSDLNSIVCIKRLTERQYKIVFNKLVKFVKEFPPDEIPKSSNKLGCANTIPVVELIRSLQFEENSLWLI